MTLDTQRPVARRWVRAAIWVGIFAGTYAALKVNAFFEGSSRISLVIFLAALFFATYFTSKTGLKVVFLTVASGVIVFVVWIRPLIRGGYVSTSALSPDGRIVAQVYEPGGFMAIDRNFVVRLKTEGRSGRVIYYEYFRSPDEGYPPTERLLWSKDGRYVLLLGTRKSLYTVRDEACLPSGECLYLLVDTTKGVTYANTIDRSNARVYRNGRTLNHADPFSADDLSRIDFGESLTTASR